MLIYPSLAESANGLRAFRLPYTSLQAAQDGVAYLLDQADADRSFTDRGDLQLALNSRSLPTDCDASRRSPSADTEPARKDVCSGYLKWRSAPG